LTARSDAAAWAAERGAMVGLESEAEALVDRLPALLIEARRISQTVVHGLHGRRRAGPGETFWQFRQFSDGDHRTLIDWRRSASSDKLFVRENEWAAAHTFWLWSDISDSMQFTSTLSRSSKRDRALVMMFALTGLLVDGGERAGLLGIMPASADRRATQRMAERLIEYEATAKALPGLPPPGRASRGSECILLSDFLDPIEPLAARISELAGDGVRGHLVQVLDPAEETLPYAGRVEFLDSESGGSWLAPRVEGLRERYRERLLAHRAELAALAQRLEWTFVVHHTDRPPTDALLALHGRLGGAAASAYRASSSGSGM
jgi:uncharacterized protein (DUF58 family)